MNLRVMRFFVYGTLKRGFHNYRRYCRGVRSVVPAEAAGELYQLPAGYPVLLLSDQPILARGTADLVSDLRVQQQWEGKLVATGIRGGESLAHTKSRVSGELLTFGSTTERLRSIDELEEFRPGAPNTYERVLIRVYSRAVGSDVAAWTYVAGERARLGRRLIPSGKWNGGFPKLP